MALDPRAALPETNAWGEAVPSGATLAFAASTPIGPRHPARAGVHPGTDHRSQVCTALTTIGVEPPAINAWDLADQHGRLAEIPRTT